MNQPKLVDIAVIHKEIEPGVINISTLRKCISDQGHKGEAGRLSHLEEIRYEKTLIIRLEHLNILKIDHLWILPNLTKLSLNFNKIDKIENLEVLKNLKELDLSFNYIEKIENLEKLTKLEDLTLYKNSIRKLENLDSLENLIILSVGRNLITSCKGIERLRFLKKLRSLNLEGNPITENSNFRLYIAAFLPQLKYYEYKILKDDERENGKENYFRELRDLNENEKEEIYEREKTSKELKDEIRLSECFVEHLNENQLFESLFVGDTDGKSLLMIGQDATDLVNEYRLESYNLTQKIYLLGLEKHEERFKEIKEFEDAVDEAKVETQVFGQQVVDEFLHKNCDLFMRAKNAIGTNNEEYQEITKEFNDFVDKTWTCLMESEIQLFERIEEANANFGVVIQEMMNEFIEKAQSFFVQLRDSEYSFCDSIQEAVTRFISMRMVLTTSDSIVPDELKECMEDKDAIINLVAGMRDFHTQVIDSREDKLSQRAKGWVTDLKTKLHVDETTRNRKKVMEINYFLDNQRDEYEKIQN